MNGNYGVFYKQFNLWRYAVRKLVKSGFILLQEFYPKGLDGNYLLSGYVIFNLQDHMK